MPFVFGFVFLFGHQLFSLSFRSVNCLLVGILVIWVVSFFYCCCAREAGFRGLKDCLSQWSVTMKFDFANEVREREKEMKSDRRIPKEGRGWTEISLLHLRIGNERRLPNENWTETQLNRAPCLDPVFVSFAPNHISFGASKKDEFSKEGNHLKGRSKDGLDRSTFAYFVGPASIHFHSI